MNKNSTFFSVVIPVLNEEKYLPSLLDDLVKQDFDDYEVIVVDGRSEDRTVEKSLEYGNKLPHLSIYESKKRNVAYQRNLGAKKAMGEWVLFMDADVRIPRHFLLGVKYRVAQKRPDVFTTWCKVDGDGSSDKMVERYINITGEVAKMLDYPAALGALIGIKRGKFAKTGGFKEKKVPLEDGLFIRDAVKAGLEFEMFRDPNFVFSLRRLRREGKLRSAQKLAKFYIKKIAGTPINQKLEYPMGGIVNEEKSLPFYSDIRKTFKVLSKRPKLRKRIRKILELLENGF